MAVTMLTPLVLVIITGVQISEEHVSLMSHVSRQPRDTSEQCGPHSYACAGTPRCVLSSQVCDGSDDCGDMSDELPGCSPCNKTYTGELGGRYSVSVGRPRGDMLPFSCFLTFSSSPDTVLQVTLDEFKLGRFLPGPGSASPGCPDGHLQMTEGKAGSEPPPGSGSGSGFLCGAASNSTRPTYISSTNTVTLTIRFFQFWADSLENSFSFSMRYKILRNLKSSSRGLQGHQSGWRGRLVPHSQCDYKLDRCSQRRCVLESPHYPGLYPRNLTCTYHIFVLPGEVPQGKQALVSVSQPESGRVWLDGPRTEKYGQTDTSLGLWAECDTLGDHVTVYDGPGGPHSQGASPALIRMCRGGRVPEVTSSGPDMLVVFSSAAYASPSASPFSLAGFQLEVSVRFVDAGDTGAVVPRDGSTGAADCRFSFSSVVRGRGVVTSIQHSLPANSSCSWQFQALPGEIVWLRFSKFLASHHKSDIYRTEFCSNTLQLMDGPPYVNTNTSMIGSWCESRPPLVCDRDSATAGAGNLTRPCSPGLQSYVSSGRGLTLTQTVRESTAVAGLDWVLHYEFVTSARSEVSSRQTGARHSQSPAVVTAVTAAAAAAVIPSAEPADCDQEFRSDMAGGGYMTMQEYALGTPRNLFLFGRGGRENITCKFRLVGSATQRVQLRFTNISMGGRACKTVFDNSLGQYRCEMAEDRAGEARSGLFLTEVEGEEEEVQQCHCQVMSNTVTTSTSSAIILTFKVAGMKPSQDYRDFLMQGSFRFINVHCQDKTKERGGGVVTLDYHSSEQAICDKRSWAVRARPGSGIYLELSGALLPRDKAHVCQARGRLIVRTAGKMFIICPTSGNTHGGDKGPVSLWSPISADGGASSGDLASVTVQLAGQSSGQVTFSWLELTPVSRQSALLTRDSGAPDTCGHVCPGLAACIRTDLVCDGVSNCPGGEDEAECPHLLVPLYYLYAVVTASLIVFLLTALVLLCRLRSCRDKKDTEAVKRMSNGTVETMLNHKHVYNNGSGGHHSAHSLGGPGSSLSGAGGSVDWSSVVSVSRSSCPDILGDHSAMFQPPGPGEEMGVS